MINYKPKVDQRPSPYPTITDPAHTIGIIGVNTVFPNVVKLVEVPFKVPSWPIGSTVSVPGYTEIVAGSPTSTQYTVNYATGFLTFNPSQNGQVVFVTYQATGAEVDALDVNELQQPVGVALNFDGSLSAGIVSPISISTSPTADFAFPRDVLVGRNLTLDGATSGTLTLGVPASVASYTLKFPPLQGGASTTLVNDGLGNLSWGAGGGGGSGQVAPYYITSNTTLPTADHNQYVLANVTSTSIFITLPTAIGNNGQRYEIKRIAPYLNSNIVTLTPFGGQTIDGYSTYVLNAQNEGAVLYSDNANWQFETKHTRDKIWTGNATEYASITTPDPHTVYFVM
jgi:hypothetical protein